jgi:hypothetical protein
MFSALSIKATASSSRAGVDGCGGYGGRVVSKNSVYLTQLVKKRVLDFGMSFSSPNSKIIGR